MMWFFLAFLLAFFLLGLSFVVLIVGLQNGWFDQFESIKRLKWATGVAFKLVENIMVATRPNTAANCSINDTELSMSITYTKYGQEKIVNIPYNRNLFAKMSQWKVYLIKDGQPIEITQEPGLPYLCTAKMLGGSEIIASNLDSSKKTLHFPADTIPSYLNLSTKQYYYN